MNKTLQQIQLEVATWATSNFPNRKDYQPLLGIIEELGELCHAHLKAEQGIRTNEDHKEKKLDACGDIIIYLLDYCNVNNITLDDKRVIEYNRSILSQEILFNISRHVGKLANSHYAEQIKFLALIEIHEIINCVWAYTYYHLNMELVDIVNNVWNAVKLRDWQKHPDNGVDWDIDNSPNIQFIEERDWDKLKEVNP